MTAECRVLGLASVLNKIWVGGVAYSLAMGFKHSYFPFNINLISMTFLTFYTKMNQVGHQNING